MRKLMRYGAAVAALATALAASAGAQAAAGRTIMLYELNKGSTFGFVDNPPMAQRGPHGEPKMLSAGDQIVFSNPIQGLRHTPLGRVNVTCTITKPGSFATAQEVCTGAFRLHDGTLLLAATLKGEPKQIQIAVIGGTGAFAGARGSVDETATKSGSTDLIHLLR